MSRTHLDTSVGTRVNNKGIIDSVISQCYKLGEDIILKD